ncbi:MAG TPA: glycine/sarcosine/betaine reductase selenoprotein B family protein [Candidatus Aquilonibacter sp.]
MPSLDKLSESTRNSALTLPVDINESTPFVLPKKALSASRVAIVTTAGLHRREDRPFTAGDPTYRVIPSETPASQIVQSHTSIGFDRTAVLEDINVVFPIDRLREMVAAGRIGELAPAFYSFMGAQRDMSVIKGQTGPEVAARLLEAAVDVVLLTPT